MLASQRPGSEPHDYPVTAKSDHQRPTVLTYAYLITWAKMRSWPKRRITATYLPRKTKMKDGRFVTTLCLRRGHDQPRQDYHDKDTSVPAAESEKRSHTDQRDIIETSRDGSSLQTGSVATCSTNAGESLLRSLPLLAVVAAGCINIARPPARRSRVRPDSYRFPTERSDSVRGCCRFGR